jgi:hypothetical protein
MKAVVWSFLKSPAQPKVLCQIREDLLEYWRSDQVETVIGKGKKQSTVLIALQNKKLREFSLYLYVCYLSPGAF